MSDEQKPILRRLTKTVKPALGPVDQVHRAVVPPDDIEKRSYKPPTGPVDQVNPQEPAPPPSVPKRNN
jgi:hypothetical protein